jgi:hypothetical protein
MTSKPEITLKFELENDQEIIKTIDKFNFVDNNIASNILENSKNKIIINDIDIPNNFIKIIIKFKYHDNEFDEIININSNFISMTKNYIKYEIIKMNDISKFNYIWIYTVP